MSDPLSHVQPGDPLTIPASAWNDVLDLVRQKNGAGGPGAPRGNLERPALVVRVKAGATLPTLAIITLGAALIDPDTDPTDAARTPLFDAEAPVAGEVPAVLLSGLSSGEIGRAVVQGVCVAPVEVVDAGHRFAVPVVGDVFALLSADSGPIRLLTNPGLGSAKCLVCLAPAPPPQNWLAPVRAAARENVNLSAPGASVDSISFAVGERFLAPFQTDAKENGVYVWNGASVAATRAPDADHARYLAGAAVVAQVGLHFGGSVWKCNLAPGQTVGSDSIPWYCALDQITYNGPTGSTAGTVKTSRSLQFEQTAGFGYPSWVFGSTFGITTIAWAGLYADDATSGAPGYSGIQMLRFPAAHFSLSSPATGELIVTPLGGSGTVTEVSGGTPADGVTVSVIDGTTTPVITVTLADITPDSVTTGAVSGTTGTFSGALTAAALNGTYDAGTW